jgi:signal transduction histidine kinase
MDKIFLMFYRATESRSGSGLGLYIVQETVSTLQGEIKVQSKKGEGTSFSIHLPNLQPASFSSEEASQDIILS